MKKRIKLSKEDFIKIFEYSFNDNIEQILLIRKKTGIGGGWRFNKFYNQISKLSNNNHKETNQSYNELDCILKFFDDKIYEKIEFPKDYEIFFSLLNFTQSQYKPLYNIQKFTKHFINILGEDLFLETSLKYFENNSYIKDGNPKERIFSTTKENMFSIIRFDYVHPNFVLQTFNLLYKKHKNVEKDLLQKQFTNIIAGRITSYSSLAFYKKLEKLDKHFGTTDFALQFYEYNLKNHVLIGKIKEYKILCEYKDLNKKLESKLDFQQSRKSIKI